MQGLEMMADAERRKATAEADYAEQKLRDLVHQRTTMKLLLDDGEIKPIAEIKREVYRFALKHYQGRVSEAARRLGVSRPTLGQHARLGD